jgi:histone deacetylase 1/2
MPLKFWDQAFLTATYLINMLPTKVLDNKTPTKLLLGEKPHYEYLWVFGCACWPNLRPYNTKKVSFRSTQCVFLGYSSLHKAFKCLEQKSGYIYISQDVVFDDIFLFSSLHYNVSARLKSKISLLCENLAPLALGDVDCHVPSINNPAASSYEREIQEQDEVQEI